MTTLIVIFAGFGAITVVVGLATFLRHIPSQQRLGVIALASTGTILIVVVSLYIGGSEHNDLRYDSLCQSVKENRIALRATIQYLASLPHDGTKQLQGVNALIQGSAC